MWKDIAHQTQYDEFLRNGRSTTRTVPWVRDIEDGRTPYFFSGHGQGQEAGLLVADPRMGEPMVQRMAVVQGNELGRFLRRRPSLTQLARDTPIVLIVCQSGMRPDATTPPSAQFVADETGRVVYAPTSDATDSLELVQGRGQPTPEWFKFKPTGSRPPTNSSRRDPHGSGRGGRPVAWVGSEQTVGPSSYGGGQQKVFTGGPSGSSSIPRPGHGTVSPTDAPEPNPAGPVAAI